MDKLSVIIPAYKCPYLGKTVDDIFKNAVEDIEVIVVIDGLDNGQKLQSRDNLIIIQKDTQTGMRNCINIGVKMASGKYIMKCDDHCAFSKGFDKALKEHSEPHQISIPSRYSLDVVTWQTKNHPVSYEYAAYPYVYLDRHRYGIGLFSRKWLGENGNDPLNMGPSEYYKREFQRKDIMIDEIMIFHGSCWFMEKSHFLSIEGLSETLFKTLYQEPQELSFKTWLTGGRVVVNKYAWYAHMHKGTNFDAPNARGYVLDITAMRETERFGNWYWMNDQWSGATKKMKWLIDKFSPIPGWPKDWEAKKIEFENKYIGDRYVGKNLCNG